MELLDPKNDYVFKRLFADSPALLAELISAVRQDEPPVEVLEVINPQIPPEELTGKTIELDVLARDSQGKLFNVEIQVQRFPKWSARSAFYLSRLLSTQIKSGRHYTDLKPVVGIHLLDFDLFDRHPAALWQFEMRDRRHPRVRLGDELTLHVVELRKAGRWVRPASAEAASGTGHGDEQTGMIEAYAAPTGTAAMSDTAQAAPPSKALTAWIMFLKHWKEARAMSELDYPPVEQALEKLQDLSLSDEERFRAIARERQLYNEATLLRDAKQEGREEGREAGSIEARIATLTRLLHRRFGALTDALPPRLHQATVQQLDGWLDRILDARTLDEVFSDAPLNARAPLTR
jgi:hypothetical protein